MVGELAFGYEVENVLTVAEGWNNRRSFEHCPGGKGIITFGEYSWPQSKFLLWKIIMRI